MLILLASLLSACAIYMSLDWPQRSLEALGSHFSTQDIPLTLLMEMVAVCVRQGASVPHALDQIGAVCQSDLGRPMRRVAVLLNQGNEWFSSWSQACSHPRFGRRFSAIRDCLEPSWRHGVSPLGRIEITIEQIDLSQQRTVEEAAAGLAVKLLLPTGLCILPAFILIGVLPCIAAFAGGLAL
ncbi:hypothetical protein [Bombiscardovia coagulans]|uniref:Pilus assembly protein n=1 Tax=Bombiscardovia coagulans TaxID=686666 RepID=A0A261EQZ0_9BIFI|nr:hypothetical protein [Bombiscardovia coagulans]OZG49280.1 pilus assembly protein [Bombiscardovia coagulans]